ncbi:MAG: hypothetical protein CMM50_16470 [Rhodospirillaceae bacterium]|nr:hypothetical protein [Rhodospirillaceae bacterium]|tara:strand:- start:114 stop:749 length:636 start_codon:yes stop_codon:yes gene_type:complete
MKPRSKALAGLLWGLVVVAPLTGCDDFGKDTRTESHADDADGTAVKKVLLVPTDGIDGKSVFADREPGKGGREILVPATSLTPGTAGVEAAIANPYDDADAVAAGERHFAAFNCSGCHAALGGGGMGPPLSDDTWIYGDEPAQIYLSIMHGRPDGMPAWGAMLPERTAWELVAYIKSLSKIDNYAAKLGFNENVDGYRPGNEPAEQETKKD